MGPAGEENDLNRIELADFLRKRRAALQPEDVGLPRGTRRRTSGLRREEVAALCGMSADYYSRLERCRGPQPSEQMIAAIARGMHLTIDERDHLFVLAGHNAPRREHRCDHVSPGLMRVLDRLEDTPAAVSTGLGETLRQTRLAVALFGDQTRYSGYARSGIYRWFTDPDARTLYPDDEHEMLGRVFTAQLRAAATQSGGGSRADAMARDLLERSEEFGRLWEAHEIGVRYTRQKRIVHPEVGLIELDCQRLLDSEQPQSLLVYTATPGSESYEKLQLLGVIGNQNLESAK